MVNKSKPHNALLWTAKQEKQSNKHMKCKVNIIYHRARRVYIYCLCSVDGIIGLEIKHQITIQSVTNNVAIEFGICKSDY